MMAAPAGDRLRHTVVREQYMNAKPLIVASHKLFLGLPEAVEFARRLLMVIEDHPALDVVISPSLLNLAHVAEMVMDSPVAIAAQNVHQEGKGAFTGQVSVQELLALHVKYVVIGHSEVIAHQHDGPAALSNKIVWCVRHGLRPIVCVTGDSDEEKDGAGETIASVLRQLMTGLLREPSLRAEPLIVYEPPSSSACDSAEGRQRVRRMLRAIREEARTLLGSRATMTPRVLYGGGVTPANARTLASELDADGFLVGRASVELSSFLDILDAIEDTTCLAHAVTAAAPARSFA